MTLARNESTKVGVAVRVEVSVAVEVGVSDGVEVSVGSGVQVVLSVEGAEDDVFVSIGAAGAQPESKITENRMK
jgi:hypothetical protein